MSKHKTVTHIPAAPAPRLAGQLVTAAGELIVVAIAIIGLITVGAWTMAGLDHYSRMATPRPPRILHCRVDRWGHEWCERVAPGDAPVVRRQLVSD
jgi:hypothetical protein